MKSAVEIGTNTDVKISGFTWSLVLGRASSLNLRDVYLKRLQEKLLPTILNSYVLPHR
jgi:hypothetical protein